MPVRFDMTPDCTCALVLQAVAQPMQSPYRAWVSGSVGAHAFPQSDDLRAQSLAAELPLETDHLVTHLAGAQACKPLLVTFADLFRRYRRWRNRYGGFVFRPLRLGGGLGMLRLALGSRGCGALAAFILRRNAFP